jgi:glycosyltransferase involved in cell wall biosynthesis
VHIVINAFSARRGGGKTYLLNLLRYFPVDAGLSVTLLTSQSFSMDLPANGVRQEKVAFPVDNPLLRIFWETLVLPFYLLKVKADVLFCPGGSVPVFNRGPWKTVTMFRNMIPLDIEQRKRYPFGYMRTRNWLLSRALMRSMEAADFVIFISDYAKQVVERLSSKGIKNSSVIHHGVSDDFRGIDPAKHKKPEFLSDSPYIVYPSIIDVYKSQVEVVRAIAKLRDQQIDLPVLLLVGEVYGRYGKQVLHLIEQLGLHQQVISVGAVSYNEMPSLYHFADFVIFASRSENCPNILLEALASGSAILCSNRMPMPEFAANAVEYFDPDDPLSLVEKIKLVLDQPQLAKRLKSLAATRAELYQWHESAAKTWELLSHV